MNAAFPSYTPMYTLRNKTLLGRETHLLLLALAWMLLVAPKPGLAQQCTFHRDCPAGTLCDGLCTPLQNVLVPSDTGFLFWVDQATGSDQNNGSQTQPWQTITRAAQVVQAGDVVVIRAGTYREAIRPRNGGTPAAFVTFAAYPGEEVIITGADFVNQSSQNYNGWQQQSDGSWRHAWVWPLPTQEDKFAARHRNELFVDNGQVLVQQGSPDRPTLQNGQFWVEGPGKNPVAVYIKTFDGTNPNKHTIEVGQRDQLFASEGEKAGKCGTVAQGFYRLISLKFVHGTSKRQHMVVCPGKYGSLLEEIEASWNNGGGIKLVGRGHIVRGAIANHNGIEGIGGTRCEACLVEHSTLSYNNWKGGPGQGHGGGGKFTRSRYSIFRHNTYTENNGPGLWLDNNNHDNEVYANRFDRNTPVGLFIEHGSSRNRIYNNVVTRTRYADVRKNTIGIGIFISASDSNLIAYNTLMHNEGSGLKIAGDNRRNAAGNLVYNNLFVANATPGPGQRREVMVIGSGQAKIPGNNTPERRWARVASNRFDGNAYWPREGSPGKKGDQALFMLSPAGPRNKSTLYTNHLQDWQQAGEGRDIHSLIADLTRPTIMDTTDPVEGWLLAPHSQFFGRAVALPEGIAPILTDFFGHPRPASGGDIGAHQND